MQEPSNNWSDVQCSNTVLHRQCIANNHLQLVHEPKNETSNSAIAEKPYCRVQGQRQRMLFILDSLQSSYSRLPISDNWTFFDRYNGSGATSEYRLEVAVFEEGGPIWTNISGRRGRSLQTTLRIAKLEASTFHTV